MSAMNWLLTIYCKNLLRGRGGGGDDTSNDPFYRREPCATTRSACFLPPSCKRTASSMMSCRWTYAVMARSWVSTTAMRGTTACGTAKDKPNASIGEAIHDAFLLTKEEFMTLVDRTIETTPVIGLTGHHLGCEQWKIEGGARPCRGLEQHRRRATELGAKCKNQECEAKPGRPTPRRPQHRRDQRQHLAGEGPLPVHKANLKRPDIVVPSRFARYRHYVPLVRAVLTAEPSIHEHPIQPEDRFLILASNGLWDRIAQRLVRAAIQAAETSIGRSYIIVYPVFDEAIDAIKSGDRIAVSFFLLKEPVHETIRYHFL
ncbi:putative protein phosphatase 2C 78 [Nymphaea thermarum]|nr:putative protein phosphatase 2C 78 [Nymphaea thermarum]